MIRGIWAVALVLWLSPMAAVSQPYDGPPGGTDYWTVPAYKDFPLKGPQAARGVVLWSHGVEGRKAQYQYQPNQVVKRFARAGWDVIKVQRNPRNERGWIPSGVRHAKDLVERAHQAKAEGYKQVIAAGQSYGGAISVEAAGKTTVIDGVLAMAPGHGSDATGSGHARMFDSLTDQLITAIGRMKTPRAVIMIAENDIYHPFEVRGPKLRAALIKRGSPFVLFDETMPLKGHGAGATPQFDQWYGACVVGFLTAASVSSGETSCEGPLMAGDFALPRDIKIIPLPTDIPAGIASLSGRWLGTMTGDRGVTFVFEKLDQAAASFVYALDRGSERKFNPSWSRRSANWNGSAFESRNKNDKFSIVFPPPGSDGVLNAVVTGTTGTVYQATLRRLAEQ